jgi:hypothetical protein
MAKRRFMGPYPNVNFAQQVNAVVEPAVGVVSGEITVNKLGAPLGAAKHAGKVSDVWFSVLASGKDDDTLSLELDLKINGVTCLTTKPVIAHVSGEASMQKTTKESGGTGVTQAVIDPDAAEYSPGDVFTYDLTLTRTNPATEMANAAVVVELEPAN